MHSNYYFDQIGSSFVAKFNTFFYKNVRLKNAPIFIFDNVQNLGKNVSWTMFVKATSPIVLCVYSFVFKFF